MRPFFRVLRIISAITLLFFWGMNLPLFSMAAFAAENKGKTEVSRRLQPAEITFGGLGHDN